MTAQPLRAVPTRCTARAPQRILINDYCGHPFQVELSRELADRGHDVLHVYSADDITPKGDLLPDPDDPGSFAIEGLTLGRTIPKYDLIRRRSHERAYGRLMCRRLADFAPDVVIGSNNPLEAQNEIGRFCRRQGIPFVFWLQDIHSDAIRSILGQRSRLMGSLLGSWYEHIERQVLRQSSHIVAISQNFMPKLHDWGIARDRITVVENWAPKDKIQIAASDNAWRRSNGLFGKKVALYTGTIGLKHNPDLLLQTAEALSAEPDVQVVVTSEGKYADYVQAEGARRGLRNLTVLPFQPFPNYGEVLATGDVLMAMIEPDAAAYSVPSKVLSYLCSGRPIVLSADERNLAAVILRRAEGGSVVDPRDPAQFIAQVRRFLGDEVASSRAGASGRAYAERAFDVSTIADRFEHICARAARTG